MNVFTHECIHLRIGGAWIYVTQVFTIKTSGELNKKGATHFISSETEDEVLYYLLHFVCVCAYVCVCVVLTSKTSVELNHIYVHTNLIFKIYTNWAPISVVY